MEFETEPYKVYAKPNADGCVAEVNSSAFLADAAGWVEVGSGYGDRYHHAQGNYLDKPLTDERGVYRYKLDGETIVERTPEEMDADAAKMVVPPTQAERISQLEADARLLLETAGDQEYRLCLMELGVSDSDL